VALHGFDLWGPSWDFTWDFEHTDQGGKRPYFIAQIGEGDEANSLPVLLPGEKANRLKERLGGTWGGVEAQVSGVLGHRKHFEQYVDAKTLELFGGLLDYCLWLDAGKKTHVITMHPERTEIYSGYLWKCVAPKELVLDQTPCLSGVYFLWEHVNFANQDALAYCLETLDRKEEQVRRRCGELLLVQKFSALVAGQPILAGCRLRHAARQGGSGDLSPQARFRRQSCCLAAFRALWASRCAASTLLAGSVPIPAACA
jgi:hypothetical protein